MVTAVATIADKKAGERLTPRPGQPVAAGAGRTDAVAGRVGSGRVEPLRCRQVRSNADYLPA